MATATNEQIVSFIELLGNLALKECDRRAKAGVGFVVPSVCIAQSAHETGWGTAPIMTRANAFFGIKAGGSWTGKVYTADTWEVKDGEAYNTVANFRAYDSLEDSVADYYNLIVNNSRYANGVSHYPDIKSAYDSLYAIWAGGYATDDEYVPNVWNLLTGRDLEAWDLLINPANADGEYNYGSGDLPPVGAGAPEIPKLDNLAGYKFEKIVMYKDKTPTE